MMTRHTKKAITHIFASCPDKLEQYVTAQATLGQGEVLMVGNREYRISIDWAGGGHRPMVPIIKIKSDEGERFNKKFRYLERVNPELVELGRRHFEVAHDCGLDKIVPHNLPATVFDVARRSWHMIN